MGANIEELCMQKGLRMTGQRRVIAQVLNRSSDHPDVNELHRRAAQKDENISLATVYRTVRLLEREGILTRIDFGDGRARYEQSPDERHHHLVDSETGKVLEFHDPALDENLEALANRLGYRLTGLRLEIYGKRIKN